MNARWDALLAYAPESPLDAAASGAPAAHPPRPATGRAADLAPEDLVQRARGTLEGCGSPAYAVVEVLPDGSAAIAPFVFAAPEPARELGDRLGAADARSRVYLVAREAHGARARYTVWDASLTTMLHRREETREDPVGAWRK